MAQPMPILKSTKNGVVSRTHPDVILTWFWMALYNGHAFYVFYNRRVHFFQVVMKRFHLGRLYPVYRGQRDPGEQQRDEHAYRDGNALRYEDAENDEGNGQSPGKIRNMVGDEYFQVLDIFAHDPADRAGRARRKKT